MGHLGRGVGDGGTKEKRSRFLISSRGKGEGVWWGGGCTSGVLIWQDISVF